MTKHLSFNRRETFIFAYKDRRGEHVATGYIFDGGEHGIYIMQESACITASYTVADRADMARLAAMTPLRDGDVVSVGGTLYRVQILGNFSDAGRLIPAAE